jgi:hypothetical protein
MRGVVLAGVLNLLAGVLNLPITATAELITSDLLGFLRFHVAFIPLIELSATLCKVCCAAKLLLQFH